MGRWNCSLNELIANHTTGQLLLMVTGAGIWDQRQQLAIAKEDSQGEPAKKKKSFKDMTSDEYEQYMHGR